MDPIALFPTLKRSIKEEEGWERLELKVEGRRIKREEGGMEGWMDGLSGYQAVRLPYLIYYIILGLKQSADIVYIVCRIFQNQGFLSILLWGAPHNNPADSVL